MTPVIGCGSNAETCPETESIHEKRYVANTLYFLREFGSMKRKPNEIVQLVLHVRPRALRPVAAAAYLGTTPFAIEELWRSGKLKYRQIGGPDGPRVSTIQQLDEYLESLPEKTGVLVMRGAKKNRTALTAVA
jgi:hypothetical protein